ncbi:MAG: flagellar basal-body rod protein FlgB [Alphaproteobacteria bacterium]|nr:flagellar basal-body rod protein FlgB [Alphaproteobacteria bacterium]
MELSGLPLFQAMKKRLAWLGQRQEVISQNIANADTPRYKAHDLKGYDFRDLIRREATQINMALTQPNQLPGQRKRIRDFTDHQPAAFETAPNGNNVVLEE